MPLPPWLRWLGVVTGALCSLLMYWTLSSLGKNLTDTVVTRAEAKLMTHGPYRWVRHPFYVTAALLMASVTLQTANWLIGVSSVAVLALLTIRTPKEEQMLIERVRAGVPGLYDEDGQVCAADVFERVDMLVNFRDEPSELHVLRATVAGSGCKSQSRERRGNRVPSLHRSD